MIALLWLSQTYQNKQQQWDKLHYVSPMFIRWVWVDRVYWVYWGVLTKNQLAGDKDSQDTCALPAHWDPCQLLGDVSHTHLESGPEIYYKCAFCKESLTQPPPWQLHRSDYLLAFCPAYVYKHTQRSRLKPAKTAAHVEKCYHACLTCCDVNSLQGSQQTPGGALWKKHKNNTVQKMPEWAGKQAFESISEKE